MYDSNLHVLDLVLPVPLLPLIVVHVEKGESFILNEEIIHRIRCGSGSGSGQGQGQGQVRWVRSPILLGGSGSGSGSGSGQVGQVGQVFLW